MEKEKKAKGITTWRSEPRAILTVIQDLTTSLQNHLCKVGAFNSTYSTFTITYTNQVKYLYYIDLQLTDTDTRNIGADIDIILVLVQP